MADIRKAISLISGGEPSPQQVQRVQAIAHSLDIPNNDPLLPILIALDAYHGVFSELPERNRISANEAANSAADMSGKMVKQHVDRVMADTVLAVTPTMKAAMEKVADTASQNAGAKSMAQWAIGCIAGTVLCFGLFGWWMHSNGYDSGKADVINGAAWMTTEVGNAAYKAVERDKEIAEWMGTSDAQRAFKMSKSGELKAIMDCSREGWEIVKQADGKKLCAPKSGKKLQFGWMVP